jgi:hypothetical protein
MSEHHVCLQNFKEVLASSSRKPVAQDNRKELLDQVACLKEQSGWWPFLRLS